MSTESSPETPAPKKKRKRPRPTFVREILRNNAIAKTAMAKINSREPLTELELFAIFKSDEVSSTDLDEALLKIPNIEDLGLISEMPNLYVEEPKIIHGYLDFWVPDIEEEMLAYFRANPDQLYSMAPRRFEEMIASIFKNNGFFVELTPETRDGGVDIIAIQKSALTGESVNLIECKRYAPQRKVGIGVVQRMLGCVQDRRANKGIIVTTSFFSKDAQHVAEKSRHQLALSDFNSISDWLAALSPEQLKQKF